MINKCGAIPDRFLDYAPSLKRLLPKRNDRTPDEIRECLIMANHDSPLCNCRVSCRETNIKFKHTTTPTRFTGYLYFKYDSNTFMDIKEIPAYPATKFVTDIAGWMSLFSGMSLLSIVEVLLFTVLSVLAVLQKLKHKFYTRRRQTYAIPTLQN